MAHTVLRMKAGFKSAINDLKRSVIRRGGLDRRVDPVHLRCRPAKAGRYEWSAMTGGASAPAGTRLARRLMPPSRRPPTTVLCIECGQALEDCVRIHDGIKCQSSRFRLPLRGSSLAFVCASRESTHHRRSQGQIDGVDVDLFHQGLTYEMPSAIAMVLICDGVPNRSMDPQRVTRI